MKMTNRTYDILFQSTLPVGGGTPQDYPFRLHLPDFNPPSPWGEGPVWRTPGRPPPYFNPPSPCGEGLLLLMCEIPNFFDFNPPSP